MSTSESKKMLTLRSSDKDDFEVEESVAIQSITIKNLVDEDCSSTVIPLPNVSSVTLAKVIEFLLKHADSTIKEADMNKFDDEFMKNFETKEELFDIILVANYLDIKKLLDTTCQHCTDTIKDFTPEDIRAYFGLENDFTPEEEQAIRDENTWAFE